MRHNRMYPLVLSSLVIAMAMCLFLLSACGTSSAEQPLVTGTPTFDIGTSTPSGRTGVAPIQVVSSQTNVTSYPGGAMSLTITTSPFAVCNIEISYGHSKPSQIPGAGAVNANSAGTASWRWYVEQNAHTGTWPLTISASLANGAKAQTQINVTVDYPPLSVIGGSSRLAAHPGGSLFVAVQTAPFITCEATYALGKSARTIGSKAGPRGLASLSLYVGTGVAPGTYPVTITELLADGETASIQVNVTIS